MRQIPEDIRYANFKSPYIEKMDLLLVVIKASRANRSPSSLLNSRSNPSAVQRQRTLRFFLSNCQVIGHVFILRNIVFGVYRQQKF